MAQRTLVIVGGGAAGFFCAVNAAAMDPGLRILILERSGKLLSKVRISGGGRCNVTHDCDDIPVMANRYPRGRNFVKRSFHGFFTDDTVRWFREHGVELRTEEDGRMFPVSNRSEDIVGCLLREASSRGVEILLHADVKDVTLQHPGFRLQVERPGGMEEMQADVLCIATGGYPKPEQYRWMDVFGHTFIGPVPSLFTFNIPQHALASLMGLSVPDAEIRLPAFRFRDRGPMLITHWGLSGPVVLRASAWCARDLATSAYEATVVVNWCAAYNEQSLRVYLQGYRNSHGAQAVNAKAALPIPQRLWEFLLLEAGVQDVNWANLPAAAQNRLIRMLTAHELKMMGKTTFKEEFVTAGGVQLSEVDPATMQSRKVPGLYFAGEVLDVDGITGGYNFQHAWTSGYNAAKDIAGKSLP
jgi:predicted Rossmann fold flavoprotein